MNIEKAIEIIGRYSKTDGLKYELDFLVAIKLGIEALKQHAQARRLGLPLRCELLPGETEETT